jgi:hypothetical protein
VPMLVATASACRRGWRSWSRTRLFMRMRMVKRNGQLAVVVGLDVLDEQLLRFAPRLAAADRCVDILASAISDDILRGAGR